MFDGLGIVFINSLKFVFVFIMCGKFRIDIGGLFGWIMSFIFILLVIG